MIKLSLILFTREQTLRILALILYFLIKVCYYAWINLKKYEKNSNFPSLTPQISQHIKSNNRYMYTVLKVHLPPFQQDLNFELDQKFLSNSEICANSEKKRVFGKLNRFEGFKNHKKCIFKLHSTNSTSWTIQALGCIFTVALCYY